MVGIKGPLREDNSTTNPINERNNHKMLGEIYGQIPAKRITSLSKNKAKTYDING